MAYKPVSQNVTDNKNAEIPSSDAVFDKIVQEINNVLPEQSGNSGKFLQTDGLDLNWVNVYPSQSTNAGKFLTTDGNETSWASAIVFPLQAPSGTVSNPAYSFAAEANTGIYFDPTYENPAAGGFGSINIARNGVLQLRVGTNIATVPGTFNAHTVNSYYSGSFETFLTSLYVGNTIVEALDYSSVDMNSPYGVSWGRLSNVTQGIGFRRPYSLDVSRRLRVGKKINDSSHYGGTLSVTLPNTEVIGQTLNTSNGTTIHFNQSSKGLYWQASVGDIVELVGLGEAKIISTTFPDPNDNAPFVLVLDKDLGGAAVANKQAILKYDLASFRLADGTEKVQIDYNGNLKLNAGFSIKSQHDLTGTITALSTDTYIGCDAIAAVTVNLPKASDVGAGKMLIIKSENGASTVTITPFAGDTCDTASLSTAQVTRLISNGVSRWIAI